MKTLRGILLVTTILAAFPAAADGANPLAERESKVPIIVSWLQSQGVKLTYLGNEGGLPGYLGESANGKMQTFYVAPDGKHVIAGIMFQNGGTNITGVQIGEMRKRFEAASELGTSTVNGSKIGDAPAGSPAADEAADKEARAPVAPAAEKDRQLEAASAAPAAAAEPPAPPVPAPEDLSLQETAPEAPPALAAAPVPSGVPVPPAPEKEAALPAAVGPVSGAKGNPSELWISKVDKAQFLAAAEATPYFEVGTRNAPVTVWMVADPQCPYCHKAWDYLRTAVYDKRVKVRVIMIAGLQGSEPIAKDMLSRPLPARAWLDSNAGTNLKLEADQSSPQWKKAGEFLEMNMEFARKFGVDRTPFLGYVADDGQFYSALGLPSDLGAFFTAAGLK